MFEQREQVTFLTQLRLVLFAELIPSFRIMMEPCPKLRAGS